MLKYGLWVEARGPWCEGGGLWMEIEGKKLPEAKRRAMGSVRRPELEEGGTAGSRADAGCGHRDVCPWRLGRQRHVQSCMQEG